MAASVEAELSRTALFVGLPPRALLELGSRCNRRIWPTGSVVFRQADIGQRCYIIVSGAVKVSAWSFDGRETILAVLGGGDFFGELALFDNGVRSADAVVLKDAELVSIDGPSVGYVIQKHPDVAIAILKVLSARLRNTNRALQEVASSDVRARVARRLMTLAASHGLDTEAGTRIDVPLSQDALAGMVGSTRESVNKALGSLCRAGIINRTGRTYTVTDPQGLSACMSP